MGKARTMQFVEMENGCTVCISHRLNDDGYLRKSWGSQRRGLHVLEMFHRFIFRAHHKLEAIPDGHEIDHLCFNRACCTPKHLRLIDRHTHLVETNQTRWLRRAAAVC